MYLLIITLNVNGLNIPAKIYRLNQYKTKSYIFCLQETHFRSKDTYTLKVRVWKKILHANGNREKQTYQFSYQKKTDFKRKVMRSK